MPRHVSTHRVAAWVPDRRWHMCWKLLFVLFAGTFCRTASADEVFHVDSRGQVVSKKGEVQDVKGGELTLAVGAREVRIPVSSIERLDAAWIPEHQRANGFFERHQYEQALEAFREAFRKEPRRWVKREMLARIVRCQANTGRVDEACRNFARLAKDDPRTHHIRSMPLVWVDEVRSDAQVSSVVQPWLRDGQPGPQQLMAASWLLRGTQRKAALQTLRQLGRDEWKPLAQLAVAQLWRAELPDLTESRVSWWEQWLESVPSEIRAGGYYLLGRTYEMHRSPDDAALAYLRVPTTYPHDWLTANAALFHCGEAMQRDGKLNDARRCFENLATRKHDSGFAERARVQLKELP